MPNLSAKLGFGPQERLLIVHADDAGMCHSANAATIRAMTEGVVSSTSVMVPCPWFPEFAAWARDNPQMDVGIHLTLTSEWQHYRWGPVAPGDKVPGLVDDEGFLWHRVEDVATRATPDEVERECRAQIERALESGIRPTHIDSHMGTLFARPDYFAVYIRLSREYGIPAMLPRPTPDLLERADAPAGVIDRLAALESEGFLFLDRLVLSLAGDTLEQRRESLHRMLRSLEPGVTQLIVHLLHDDPEARHIAGSWRTRVVELELCIEPETRRIIEEEGIRLIGYRPLVERWPKEARA